MNIIENKTFDEERALYNIKDTKVKNCMFAGEKDGESAMKEARNIEVADCIFKLRYPMWHVDKLNLVNSKLEDTSRAPIWYSKNGIIDNVTINSVKAIRECDNITIKNSIIDSIEFGWKSNNINIIDSKITSEYLLLDSKNIKISNIDFKGKYSFQYVENLKIDNSILDTKDAFWHSNNVTVKNSIIKGEYLGWFSKSLTLDHCKIIGTQPLCYAENLKIIDCEMIDTDKSFEYSSVNASIIGNILSIKNPKSGKIIADSIDEIIMEDSIMESDCKVIIRSEVVESENKN